MGTINYKTSNYITMATRPESIADYENDPAILEKYSFYYFHIKIEPGYYEGFFVDIENNFSYFYDNAEQKREAYKETAEIKKFLEELAGCGIVSVFPGWSTTYRNYTETMKDIKKAIAEMRAEIKHTPTYRTLHAAGEI